MKVNQKVDAWVIHRLFDLYLFAGIFGSEAGFITIQPDVSPWV